jgi:hypothetical protein
MEGWRNGCDGIYGVVGRDLVEMRYQYMINDL